MSQSQLSSDSGFTDGKMEITNLRSMYELPYLAQFLTLNKEKFNFPSIDTEILENCLSIPQDLLITDLFARILRHLLQNTNIRSCSFESHLSELLVSRGASWNPLANAEYKTLTATDRLKLLKWLAEQTKEKKCEIKDFLAEDFDSAADCLEDKEINVGQDSENRTYWYFHDLRLYRSKNSPHSKEGAVDWQCVAITLDGWQSLINELEKSKNEQEKELYTYLNEQLFLPSIKLVLENKASGKVVSVQRPTDDEINVKQESDISKMQGANTTDPKANPELTKVLNEEPSSNIPKDHDKSREDHSRKSGDDRKGDFGKNGTNQNGGTKMSQETLSNQSSQVFVFSTLLANKAASAVASGTHNSIISYHLEEPNTKRFIQHHGMKMSPQMPPHGPALPMKIPGPYSSMNGTANPSFPPQNTNTMPNHVGWNGQRAPMPGYNNIRPESPGVWGPAGPANQMGPNISQTIVPDENLTPEQRQNREAGMASLKKIHEMLLADEQTGGMHQMTNFSHINMAQDRQGPVGPPHMQPHMDEFSAYGPGPGAPPMGPAGMPGCPGGPHIGMGGQMMGPNGQLMQSGMPPMGPGSSVGPGVPMMGHGGQPMGPGMMVPGHPHHNSSMGSPMGPGPMPPGHPQMGPGPLPPHMTGGPPMDMAMYPGGTAGMHPKPPPPYHAPMAVPADAPTPRASKSKKRKGSTQSPAPQSPMGQPLKSPKYQIPPSPLAASQPGVMPGMVPGFPGPDQAMLPGGPGHPQMYNKGPHGAMPPHLSQQGNLMQAGPPEPFQGHPASGSSSHKPPPTYLQSTNKRVLESMTTPPAHKQYYSQFENQELTIIKQPNTAYQSSDITEANQFPPQSGRLPGAPGSPMNPRSNITNITSASLANLAKGVEQIQQHMVEGGPFRDLQQQPSQQQPGMAAVPIGSGPVPMSTAPGQSSTGPNAIPATSGGSQPSVNNTFVNAHMSIGQVNIQNVNASQQHAGFDSSGRPTQMQQNVDVTMNTGNATPGTPRFSGEEPNFPPPNPPPTANSVKVQAKGGNTLQYLPVSHHTALPPANDPIVAKQQSFDFGAPLPNLDSKTPTSKISYYPDNSRLPPPPPQRLPQSMNNSIPQVSSQAGLPQYSAPHPGLTMHPTPAPHMSPGMPPNHGLHMTHFTSGHPSMMPPASGMYSPHSGLYGPMAPPLGQEVPHSNMGMMEQMHSPHGHPGGQMVMSHLSHHGPLMSGHHSMMPQPQSPFNPPGPMEFGSAHHGPQPGFPGDFPPNGIGHMPGQLSRQMSHPGHPAMPPQMMMPSQGSPYMNGPAPGPGPYMMGGL